MSAGSANLPAMTTHGWTNDSMWATAVGVREHAGVR